MKKLLLYFILLTSMFFSSCSSKKVENTPTKNLESILNKTPLNYDKNENMYFLTEYISSPSLKNNKLGDPNDQPVRVFLPPSYHSTQKKYPAVYYLHSFGSSFLEIDWYKNAYKKVMSTKGINEFILVGINGRNRFDGSFYVNSPVTGNWEDYVVKDVVNFIDSKYRTIPNPNSRGISGFSMGGFGAINISFHHPQVFSCVFAISPGIFQDNDIQKVLKTWNSKMVTGYGVAFAPNLNKPYPYVNVPKFDNSETDNKILEEWKNGAGNLNGKVTKYINNIVKLKGIQIEYGTKDFFDWIPDGCKSLSKILNDNNIKNKLLEFEGSHGDQNHIIVERDMFPYFSRLLKTED